MKYKMTEVKKFVPFKIEILIENENDMKVLWHRLNINDIKGSMYSDEFNMERLPDCDGLFDLWNDLDQKATQIKLDIKG